MLPKKRYWGKKIKVAKENNDISFVFTFISKFFKIIMPFKVKIILVAKPMAWLVQHFSEMLLLVYIYVHMCISAMVLHKNRKEILSCRGL